MCSSVCNSLFSFNLRNNIFQSAKKCEMTSSSMTSLHIDLKEAANRIDYAIHIGRLLIAPSHTSKKYKMATIFGPTHDDTLTNL